MNTVTDSTVEQLAFFLEVEHGLAIGLTGLRADTWRERLAKHRRATPECSVCGLLKKVGYYEDNDE